MVGERHSRGRGIAVVIFSATVAGVEESVATNRKSTWQFRRSHCMEKRWVPIKNHGRLWK